MEPQIPNPVIEITGHSEDREIERIVDKNGQITELIPGDSTYKLVLKFPNGRKHMAKVSREVFELYLEAAGLKEPDPPVDLSTAFSSK